MGCGRKEGKISRPRLGRIFLGYHGRRSPGSQRPVRLVPPGIASSFPRISPALLFHWRYVARRWQRRRQRFCHISNLPNQTLGKLAPRAKDTDKTIIVSPVFVRAGSVAAAKSGRRQREWSARGRIGTGVGVGGG